MIPRDLLARCSSYYPERVAYCCGEQTRTWRRMDERASRLGAALQGLGVRKGSVVAVFGRESFQIYEHFFACIKTGAVRLGVNWRYPAAQILYVLRDSGASVLLAEAGFEGVLRELDGALRELGIRVIGYGGDHGWPLDYESLLQAAAETPALPEIAPEDVLFHSYTSGTTGHPKGVMLTHGGVVHAIFQSLVGRGLTVDDVWYMAGQSSWMAVIMSMFGLGNGMTHVIPDGQFEIARFLRDIERFRVTVASLFPIMMQRAIREVRSGHYDLSTLCTITYGSAPAAPRLLREAHDFFGCGFLQAYGLTESGGWVTHLSPADHREGFAGRPELLASAGRPGLLYDVAVCDEDGRRLPAGSPGEVWVRGPSIMKGYVNLPEQTAQVLKGGWLRTHDIGRQDAEGYLYLVDRKNFMIISGAVNVYPAAVETVLHRHPDVEEAAVLGAPHPEWGEAVVAIVRRREGRKADGRELVAFCQAHLSRPESPKHVLFTDALPRTSTGKIDKALLRNWLREHAALLPWSAQAAAEESLKRSET